MTDFRGLDTSFDLRVTTAAHYILINLPKRPTLLLVNFNRDPSPHLVSHKLIRAP